MLEDKLNINEIITQIMPRKLREFRLRADLKIEEVAQIINKTPAMISNYENGKSIPSASMLFHLCRIYKVEDINEIFSDEFLSKNFKCSEYLTKPEYELVQLYRNADKDGQFASKVVLKAFSK